MSSHTRESRRLVSSNLEAHGACAPASACFSVPVFQWGPCVRCVGVSVRLSVREGVCGGDKGGSVWR